MSGGQAVFGEQAAAGIPAVAGGRRWVGPVAAVRALAGWWVRSVASLGPSVVEK